MLKPRFDPFRFTRPLTPTQEERRSLIEAAAYRRAQQRNFAPGDQLRDWLAAEAEVDSEISLRHLAGFST